MPLARADVRDVCFAHWPVPANELDGCLPSALSAATRDDSAWISMLAQRTRAGVHGLPGLYEYPQLAVRTYVVPAQSDDHDDVGIYFLHVEANSWFASLGARLLYDVPFRHAPVFHHRDGAAFDVGTTGSGGGGPFRATFDPVGDPTVPDPDSPVAWLTDRYDYYLPDGRRGETVHPPWRLADATVTIQENRLFDGLNLPDPCGDPVFRYSPGAEFRLSKRP